MVIASTGISNLVPESHFILDDIRQIRASAADAWQKAPTELPEILPLTPEHTSGLVPEQEGRHLHPFWNKWYQSVIAGTAPNWSLINRIAQIDDAAWEEGAATLDKAIDDAVDDLSIAMTENGETVEINPETGKLRLVPTADLPEEMGIYVRRKMLKAIAVFEQPLPQSYRALTPDLAMLQCAVEDAQNLPVELYDACSSALLRLALRAEQGECPPVDGDPLLADYRNRLRDAGADILGSNAEARRVLERRQAITDNDELIKGCDTINEVVATVAPLLEGRLAETLPQDAAIATDPNSDPAERRSASFRLSGRLLRILRFTAAIAIGAGLTFRALTKGAELLEAMQFLAGNPIVKDAQRIIYEMLNLR